MNLYSSKLPTQLDALLARANSPTLGLLVEEWLSIGAEDRGLRDRSMERYASSWRRFWELLPHSALVSDLTARFVADFRRYRRAQANELGKPLSPATIHRDLAALGVFLSWCADDKNLKVGRPRLRYNRESRGRLRWLSAEELRAFNVQCPLSGERYFDFHSEQE